MKFGQQLSDQLIPEWRYQYLNYKDGKKRLKKLLKYSRFQKTINNLQRNALGDLKVNVSVNDDVNDTDGSIGYSPDYQNTINSNISNPVDNIVLPSPLISNPEVLKHSPDHLERQPSSSAPEYLNHGISPHSLLDIDTKSKPPSSKKGRNNPPESLQKIDINKTNIIYNDNSKQDEVKFQFPNSKYGTLPSPVTSTNFPQCSHLSPSYHPKDQNKINEHNSPEFYPHTKPPKDSFGASSSVFSSYTRGTTSRLFKYLNPSIKNSLRSASSLKNGNSTNLQPTQSIADAEQEFLIWLDSELDKVNKFFLERQKEAETRYDQFRPQLELLTKLRAKRHSQVEERPLYIPNTRFSFIKFLRNHKDDLPSLPYLQYFFPHSKKKSSTSPQSKRDYDRKNKTVTYRSAKRQLKIAIMEYYRSVELLKSFAGLNKEGFRKMIKKFDKTTGLKLQHSYMTKVEDSPIGNTVKVDKILTNVEDIYTLYFEKGDRKHAIAKIRGKALSQDFTLYVVISGLFLGASIPLLLQGIVVGLERFFAGTSPLAVTLFQIWAGFFFISLFFCLFGINCAVWHHYKINYPFIFEFDPRDHLDYREYMVLPSINFFWMSLWAWLCFQNYWPQNLYQQYYPVIYLCSTSFFVCLPVDILFWRARRWLVFAIWRVFLSGFYPVEFRDFFLGDILTSLSYATANISLFFCMYANNWNPGAKCGSHSSRLMGFFGALPFVFRLLQCLRRYADSGSWFPHLANCGKYSIGIISSAFLSCWRIELDHTYEGLFITFAAIYSIYASLWDLLMDWSLFQFGSRHKFLRNELAFHYPIYYYISMVINLIIRMSWIFYAIFTRDIQHSAAVGFFVSFAEVFRRFIWLFFRMENEHCANVGRVYASRELPLPFRIENDSQNHEENEQSNDQQRSSSSDTAKKVQLQREFLPVRNERELENGIRRLEPMESSSDKSVSTPLFKPKKKGQGSTRETQIKENIAGVPISMSIRKRTNNEHNSNSFQKKLSSMAESFTPKLSAIDVSSILQKAHTKDFERRKSDAELIRGTPGYFEDDFYMDEDESDNDMGNKNSSTMDEEVNEVQQG